MLIELSDEQIARLQALKQEMLTQDTCCQAAPRYWGIAEETTEYGVASVYADAFCLVDEDGNIVGDHVKDFFDVISDLKDEIIENRDAVGMSLKIVDGEHLDVHIDYDDESYDDERIDDAEDAAEFLNDSDFEYSLCGVRFNTTLVHGPIFLTKKACENHIKRYGYNYKNAKPYAMTAYRSPEIEFLWDLIQETDWSNTTPGHDITREMVEEAYDSGLLRIEKSPVDDCIAAYIGEHWFYFGGYPACEMSSERYAKQVPTQYILDYVHKALEELRNDNETEYDYYFFFLKEHGVGKE